MAAFGAPAQIRGLRIPFPPKNLEFFMAEVKSGDTVAIHYTGTLLDGTTFDSSEGRDPLEFVVGSGQIIPGLDVALPGMEVGEKKVVKIACTEAYGPLNPEMRQAVPREGIPADIPLEVGTQLQMQTPDGQAMPVMVVEVDEATVTLDANHPLAGKDLQFDIELVKIDYQSGRGLIPPIPPIYSPGLWAAKVRASSWAMICELGASSSMLAGSPMRFTLTRLVGKLGSWSACATLTVGGWCPAICITASMPAPANARRNSGSDRKVAPMVTISAKPMIRAQKNARRDLSRRDCRTSVRYISLKLTVRPDRQSIANRCAIGAATQTSVQIVPWHRYLFSQTWRASSVRWSAAKRG
tara:strand:- start:2807 stop:3868 length:1062 start_codon:yes stop_codon:yes gene_type:complete